MPLRTRVKRAFTRSSNSSADSTPSTTTPSSNTDLTTTTTLTTAPTATSTKSSKSKKFRLFRKGTSEWDDWPEHLYKPHEIPPPKYKRVPAKEHTEHLEAYSFASALENFRRRSATSLYSPMGSRMPSRFNSVSSRAGRSGPSRSQSIATESVPEHGHDDDSDTVESNSGNIGSNFNTSDQKTSTLGGDKTPTERLSRPTTLIARPVSTRSSTSATTAIEDHSTSVTSKTVSPDEVGMATTVFSKTEPHVSVVNSTYQNTSRPSSLRIGIAV